MRISTWGETRPATPSRLNGMTWYQAVVGASGATHRSSTSVAHRSHTVVHGPIAQRLMAEWDSAFGELARFVAGGRGRITVAALPSMAAVLLPPAIEAFRKSHPHVEFLVRDGLSDSVLQTVADGQAEMGLTVRPTPRENLIYRPLLADAFGLVCRRDDPLVVACQGEKGLPWSIFETQRFVAMAPKSSVRAMTDAAFLRAGLAVTPLYECAFLGTAGNLIAKGLGITALPRLTMSLVGAHNLIWRPLVRPKVRRAVGVVTRARRTLSPTAAAFLELLVRRAQGHGAESGP